MSAVSPTVSGSCSGDEVRVSAMTNSFQAAIKVKINAVASPGSDSGRTIRIRVDTRLHPSIHAASSTSCGMLAKKLERIQIEKAILNAA